MSIFVDVDRHRHLLISMFVDVDVDVRDFMKFESAKKANSESRVHVHAKSTFSNQLLPLLCPGQREHLSPDILAFLFQNLYP